MQLFAGELKYKIGTIAMHCAAAFDRLWVFASLQIATQVAYVQLAYVKLFICNLLTFCLCIYCMCA